MIAGSDGFSVTSVIAMTADGANQLMLTFVNPVEPLSPNDQGGEFTLAGCDQAGETPPGLTVTMSADNASAQIALAGGQCNDEDLINVTVNMNLIFDASGTAGLAADDVTQTYRVDLPPAITVQPGGDQSGAGNYDDTSGTPDTVLQMTFNKPIAVATWGLASLDCGNGPGTGPKLTPVFPSPMVDNPLVQWTVEDGQQLQQQGCNIDISGLTSTYGAAVTATANAITMTTN
jgi:hypothetical protein